MTHGDDQVQNLIDQYVKRDIDRRQFFGRAAVLGISLSGATALLAACEAGEEEAAPPATGGTLRVRLSMDIENLDPAFWASDGDLTSIWAIYEGLIGYKPGTWEIVNQLAEEFTSSPDGLRHTFKLKEGVPWHGGYGEVTAADVKFSYERIAGLIKSDTESPYADDWAALKQVKLTGRYSGEIVLKRPFAPLMQATLPNTSGLIVSRKAVEDRGKKYATSPIGTGPYEFAEWSPGQQIVFKRFKKYGGASSDFNPAPQWDEIEGRVIADTSPAEIALESGDVEFGEISNRHADRFAKDDRLATRGWSILGYEWIGMNLHHPKLSDVNVRQAIRYGIDVPAIIEAGYDGKATRAHAIIPESMELGYWPAAPRYERDVEKAKGYLQQAGLPSLDLEMVYGSGYEPYDAMVLIARESLAEVGINITPKRMDGGAYNEYFTGPDSVKEVQLFAGNFLTAPDPHWSFIWFTCEQVKVWNWMFWCDKRYDQLLKDATVAQEPEKRTQLYIEMQKLMDEAVHSVWVAYPNRYYAWQKRLQPAVRPDGQHEYLAAFTTA